MNFRKAGATSAMKPVSGDDMEVISQHMSHSQAISKKTYRNRERLTSACSAFSKMQELHVYGNVEEFCTCNYKSSK